MATDQELEQIRKEWQGVVNITLPQQKDEITVNAFSKAFGITRDKAYAELERLVTEEKATKRKSSDPRVTFYRLKDAK